MHLISGLALASVVAAFPLEGIQKRQNVPWFTDGPFAEPQQFCKLAPKGVISKINPPQVNPDNMSYTTDCQELLEFFHKNKLIVFAFDEPKGIVVTQQGEAAGYTEMRSYRTCSLGIKFYTGHAGDGGAVGITPGFQPRIGGIDLARVMATAIGQFRVPGGKEEDLAKNMKASGWDDCSGGNIKYSYEWVIYRKPGSK